MEEVKGVAEEQVAVRGVAAKLLEVMKACGGYVQKEARNNEQKYNYVPEGAVLRKVQPTLVEQGLVALPAFSILSEKDKPTRNGAIWQLVTVECKLNIIDTESKESLTVVSLGSGTDSGDKAVAKAQTMAFKYAWLKALNLETGDDPEKDTVTDKQEFTQEPPEMAQLRSLWQQMGWNGEQLPQYIQSRYQRPWQQLAPTELQCLINEIHQQQQFRQNQGG